MELNRKLCLVTGGAGFIGSHLVNKLMLEGARVRVLDDLSNGKEENISHHFPNGDFEFIRGSVTESKNVEHAMKGVQVVFHLACLGLRHSIAHPFENHRVNAEGSLIVLEAARTGGAEKFIYCSSSEVYGTAKYVPMPESHPTRPCTVYGASKLAGEAYARAYHKTYGMDTVIVRPFNTYGPRSHHEGRSGEMIPKSIVRALAGRDIIVFGNGTQTRDFTYVEDIARGLTASAICDNSVGKTLNMGSTFEISIKDLAFKILKIVGNPDAKVQFTPPRPGDVLRLWADSSRFIELTGWKPEVDFETGLRRTLEYFRNHPLGVEALMKSEAGRNW